MPRVKSSSETPSTRATRSTKSRSSNGIAGISAPSATRASASSPGKHMADEATSALDGHVSGDLQTQAAQYVTLVHMDQMAQYIQSSKTQQGLDLLLDIVKHREGGPQSSDYQSALNELDYLEGLFKKLRFSYKEQLTKETVVRRILELELPLLSASDIDAMVQDTEAERQQLRAIKSVAREQGVAAETMTRILVEERRYVTTAEAEMTALPNRLLQLRQRLVRMKLALRSELQSMDESAGLLDTTMQTPPLPTPFSCTNCHCTFYTEAFLQLHEALHDASKEDEDAIPVSPLAWRKCYGCDRQVPAFLYTENVSGASAHEAFHGRVQREIEHAQQALDREISLGDGDMEWRQETEKTVVKLQGEEAHAAELEARAQADAARQTAIEGEMEQSLKHLRDSVGSIRQEVMRIEQEANRMVRYMEAGRAHQGRTLQEQSDLFEILLGDGEPMAK